MMNISRIWAGALGMVLPSVITPNLPAAEFRVIEAEKCRVSPGHAFASGFLWASGGGQVHEFWGEETNDSIEFELSLTADEPSPKLGIRYSYNLHHYLGIRRRPQSVEGIVLQVDGGAPIQVAMPGTGDWHIYRLVEVALLKLSKGRHKIVLRSTAAGSVRNIDCFVYYTGPMSNVPAWLRSSVAYEDPRFWVLASPGTDAGSRIQPFVSYVSKSWGAYADYFGHEGPKPLKLHVIANGKWDNPGATAYQNNAGLFFLESTFDKDLGNILHEMCHHFHVGRLPGWLDEPMVRTLTTFVWAPQFIPGGDPNLVERTARAKEAARDSRRPMGSADDVLAAIVAEHGREVFKKFWASVHQAEGQGRLARGAPLNKTLVIEHLSKAGKDVRPLFERWAEFKRVEPAGSGGRY